MGFQFSGDDDAGHLILEIALQSFFTQSWLQFIQKAPFAVSDDLNAIIVKIIIKAGQLQSRTVDILNGNQVIHGSGNQNFQLEIVDEFFNCYCHPRHHPHMLYPCCPG
ncbi:hypothetical protein SDC9_168758 [bioreactor metagenome]|uniref:Uncharacterized protein n=1 Tax=bioreactor metagenome TaxID=1076179 RepID=A0A645G6E9_9ZZZZ